MANFRKKYLADWFRGKKFLQWNTCGGGGGFPTLKKIIIIRLIILRNKLTPSCMSGKKVISPEVAQKKNSSPNEITHSPSQKSNGRPLTILFVCKIIHYHFGQKFSCNFRLATSRLHWLRDRNCTKCSIVLISQLLSQLVFLFIYFYNWYTYNCSRTF